MPDSDYAHVTREAIGERLRMTREALSYNLTDFSKKCGIGKTRYENYESGRNLIKPEVAVRIIQAFPEAKLDFNWIYHGDLDGVAYVVASKIPLDKARKSVA